MTKAHLLLAAPLLVVLGCGTSDAGTVGEGRVSVLLKDAPAEITKAVVTITQIELVGAGAPVVLSTDRTTTDLLTLANDTATLVDGAPVPAGTYSQLRFVIEGGYLEAGGVIYASSADYEGLPQDATVGGELRMPSYDKSGLKILFTNGLVVGTDTTTLIVDFDVKQSFGHVAGNSGAWVMHPVVKGATIEETGSVEVSLGLSAGTTLPAGALLGDFKAVLTPSDPSISPTTVPLTSTDGVTYGVTFQYVFPGSYTVTFEEPQACAAPQDCGTYSPAVPASVEVQAGQVAHADFILSVGSAGPPEDPENPEVP